MPTAIPSGRPTVDSGHSKFHPSRTVRTTPTPKYKIWYQWGWFVLWPRTASNKKCTEESLWGRTWLPQFFQTIEQKQFILRTWPVHWCRWTPACWRTFEAFTLRDNVQKPNNLACKASHFNLDSPEVPWRREASGPPYHWRTYPIFRILVSWWQETCILYDIWLCHLQKA